MAEEDFAPVSVSKDSDRRERRAAGRELSDNGRGDRSERRTDDRGMALGAEAGAIRRMVLQRGLAVAGIGTLAGIAGALALSKLMASIVFQVSPFDPVVLAGAALFMLVVASIAAYLPARRATATTPASALQ